MRVILSRKNMFTLWLILAGAFISVELVVNAINIDFFGKSANWYRFIFQPLNYFLWILFLPLVFLIQNRFSQNQQGLAALFAKHFLAAIGLCLLHRVCVELVLVGLLGVLDPEHALRIHPIHNSDVFWVRVLTGGLGNLFLYVISVAIVILIGYQERLKEELERRFQAERDKTLAELRALKMQFSPHFLLNALNGAVSLVERGGDEAADYLLCLGDMLQYTMAQNAHDAVNLEAELDFAENYLQVQKMRFGDRLEVNINLDTNSLKANVPPFCLQPLTENAVKHGLESGPEPCSIEIKTQQKQKSLVLEVCNTLQTAAQLDAKSESHGTGLKNLSERLNLFYSGRAAVETRKEADRFIARIEVPDV
jgi:hypothetical protein